MRYKHLKRIIKLKFFLISVFFILFFESLYPQQYFFRKYSNEEGLPQSTVYCLLQDSRGYIWMGTEGGGLTRFDGNRFDTYTKADGLSDNTIRSLYEDLKGNLWIGTNSGLTIYDGYSFKIIDTADLASSGILKITGGYDSTVWIGTNDKGLFGIIYADSVKVRNYSLGDGLSNIFISDIYQSADRKLWLAMLSGIDIVEFDKSPLGKIRNIIKPDFKIPAFSVCPDNKGDVWIGGFQGHGLYKALTSSGNTIRVIPSELNKQFPNLVIWDILCRKDGEIWLATDNNGVIKIRDDKLSGNFYTGNGLQSNNIFSLMEDSEGNTWLASLGQGVFMYDDEKFVHYGQKEGIMGNLVSAIIFKDNDIFYTSTDQGVTCFKKEGNIIKKQSIYTKSEGLNDIKVNALALHDNKILIGTNSGINIPEGHYLISSPVNLMLKDQKINCLLNDSQNNLWIGTGGGFGRYSQRNMFFMDQDAGLIHNEVQTIIEDTRGRIWIGTVGGLVRLNAAKDLEYADFNKSDGLSTLWVNCLSEDASGNIWVGTFGGGIFRFDIRKDSVPISPVASKGVLSSDNISSLLFINDTMLIAGTDKGFDYLVLNNDLSIRKSIHYGIKDGFAGFENNNNSIAKDNDGYIWFGTKNGLVRFNPHTDETYHFSPPSEITGIKLFFKSVDWNKRKQLTSRWSGLPENLVLPHNENHITFSFTGFSYHNPEELMFRYILEPQGKEWSPYGTVREIPFSGLAPGNYIFKVEARNKFGYSGKPSEFRFVIKPPFWKTKWFLGSSALVLILLVVTVVRIRERKLIREKIRLENIVIERTRQIVEQKDEIERQRDLVTYQKKEITDSINYAERIQLAVLPDEKVLRDAFSEYFILYMPKDIVSGDFYWMSRRKDQVVFTAADCTGHGVPGAFMSMLGVSFLNKIVNESCITDPAKILTDLRLNIVEAMKQTGAVSETRDGMDIALCTLDLKKMKFAFAGANNPMYLISKLTGDYKLTEIKGDRMPVGFHSRMDSFTKQEVEIHRGDTIYLFSDGIVDQFGGPEGKKFMKNRFMQMLLDHQDYSMSSQKDIYMKIIKEWISCSSNSGHHQVQIDDIMVMGVRI